MRRFFAAKWWIVLPIYLLGGLALGLADPQLGGALLPIAGKPGIATAMSVNILMPALVLLLAVVYPRLWTAWLGALVMTAAFIGGLAVNYPPAGVDAMTLLMSVKPVLVLACLGYAVLGTVVVVVTHVVKNAGGFHSPPTLSERD
jgi:hypothetical protein